jgi:hypothetical protein
VNKLGRRGFLRLGGAALGSAAGVIAARGKPLADSLADVSAANGAPPGSDFITVGPASPTFSGLTQGFNRRWSAPNCRVIYVPLTESGAQAALEKIVADGMAGNFGVRSGGHCYEDFVFNPATQAIIDLSLLKEVGYDADRGVYFAQAGGTTWDLYRGLLWKLGKTLPGGTCYSVGLGGHITGGGYGMLSRKFGLTVDWLSAVRIVVAQGPSLLRVAANSTDRDQQNLFWANTGGGGGNFGIVTRYEFAELPSAPRFAELTSFSWEWSTIIRGGGRAYLQRIITFFENLNSVAPNSMFGTLTLNHQSAGEIGLIVQNVYDGTIGATSLSPLIESLLQANGIGEISAVASSVVGPPPNVRAQVQHLRWIEAVQTLNESGPNQKGKQKSAYMRAGFTRSMVTTLFKFLTARRRTPNGRPVDLTSSLLQIDSYGGAINTVDPAATAVAQRSSIFKLQYQTYWQDPEDGPSDNGDGHLSWIRDFYSEMYADFGGIPDPARDPSNNVDECYINMPDADLNEFGLATALRLYYGRNLGRLIQTKQRWDPSNLFHHAQSIPPD